MFDSYNPPIGGCASLGMAFALARAAPQAPIVSNIRNALPWAAGTFRTGQRCTNAEQAYECIIPGMSTGAPIGRAGTINNGGAAVFKWSSVVDFSSLAAWVAANQGTLTRPIKAQFWNDRPGMAWGSLSTRLLSLPTWCAAAAGRREESVWSARYPLAPGEP
jgi:hypothetical protein